MSHAIRFLHLLVVLLLFTPTLLLARQSAQNAPASVQLHPLDPLTAVEIETAASVLTTAPQFPEDALFATIVLKEPPKSEVLSHASGGTLSRQAFAVILDRKRNRTFEAVVELAARRIASWNEIKGMQPVVLEAEYELLVGIVKNDPRWQAAMRKRGIDNLDHVQIDYWAAGDVPPKYRGRRVLRALSYFKGDSTNFYGRPIEGVVLLVDMNTDTVVEFIDSGVVPLPPPSQELDEKSTGVRAAPKVLAIDQPDGTSFTVSGQEVRWQKWRFRYTMHPREGLVLHAVGYEDDGRVRPILYRASVSEMAVPYGDTDRNWRWRSAFDVGEYGMGRLASPIEPKTDAPPNATLIDVTFAGDNGAPYVLPRAVGIYERDGGLLWKHYETYTKTNESRRARELVIFFIATIGNYDYAINWIFHQDGILELDAALSGIMLPKGVAASKVDGHAGTTMKSGHLVSANVVAPHHQHFFNFRLDFDVDGTNNSVHEMNTRALPPGRGNPSLNGMVMEETVLRTEAAAQRQMSMPLARTWAIVNPSAQNALGHHTSYILVPGVNSLPYVAPTSLVRQRAGFINQHFWATRYNADEMYAAGAYPNQSVGGAGLPRWVANNETISNQDVVVWYTMGVTHIPRPEEWPVMPVTHVGFKMLPGGFFSRNPALDVPR
jgi:primary-amine oxidase